MDPASIWTAIERLSAWFYDPVVFWTVPLGLAAIRELLGAQRRRGGGPAH